MKPAERDELLIRLDERTANINEDVKELKEAVKESNGRQHKLSKKVNTIIGVLIGCGILGGGSIGLVQLLGG